MLIDRRRPAVALLNDLTIAVYSGSNDRYILNNGIVFHVEKNTCTKILGGNEELKFYSFAQAQQVEGEHFVTLGHVDDGHIHMMQLTATSNGSYYETRSIRDYGCRFNWVNLVTRRSSSRIFKFMRRFECSVSRVSHPTKKQKRTAAVTWSLLTWSFQHITGYQVELFYNKLQIF